MKLKTLKDMKTMKDIVGDLHIFYSCDKRELKAEAIKWVKYLAKSELIEDNDKVTWIMNFFNITEEDLTNSLKDKNTIKMEDKN